MARHHFTTTRPKANTLTRRDIERLEARGFERDYERSRHNQSNPRECPGTCGELCRRCPERDALVYEEREAA